MLAREEIPSLWRDGHGQEVFRLCGHLSRCLHESRSFILGPTGLHLPELTRGLRESGQDQDHVR